MSDRLDPDGLGVRLEGVAGPFDGLRVSSSTEALRLELIGNATCLPSRQASRDEVSHERPQESPLRRLLRFIFGQMTSTDDDGAHAERPLWLAEVFSSDRTVMDSYVDLSGESPVIVAQLTELPDDEMLIRWLRRAERAVVTTEQLP